MSEMSNSPIHPSSRLSPQRDEPAWVELLRNPMNAGKRVHVHLVGIGGTGLSAIAGFLLERGF